MGQSLRQKQEASFNRLVARGITKHSQYVEFRTLCKALHSEDMWQYEAEIHYLHGLLANNKHLFKGIDLNSQDTGYIGSATQMAAQLSLGGFVTALQSLGKVEAKRPNVFLIHHQELHEFLKALSESPEFAGAVHDGGGRLFVSSYRWATANHTNFPKTKANEPTAA